MFSQACVKNSVKGGAGVYGGGACVAGGRHGRGCVVWGEGAVCAWQGACMVGGMCGRGHAWQGGHAWQDVCVAGGMHGRGRGHAWQERRPLQRTV